MEPDPDTRILQLPARPALATPRPAPRGRRGLLVPGLGLLAVAGGLGAWLLTTPPAPPPASPQDNASASRPAAGPAPLMEAGLLALAPAQPLLCRWAATPEVFVLVFPDLAQQAAALNRVAALVEKAGLPRDRVLSPEELAEAITASEDRPETWLLAHDYAGADLDRFRQLAARDALPLNPAELLMLDALAEARSLVPPGQEVALVSLPGAAAGLEPELRAAILRHELSHGLFFTRPAVAAAVRWAWRESFTEVDRAALRTFLAREGYDTQNEALLANEAMAYLAFTPNERIFGPQHVALPPDRLEELRAVMRKAAGI